jgi:hypothetical protein
MILNKNEVIKELRKLSNKDIQVIVETNKKKRRVHSLSFLSLRYIKFEGPITLNNDELTGVIAHELIHIKERHFLKEFLILLMLNLSLLIAMIYILLESNLNMNPYYVIAILVALMIIISLVVYIFSGRIMERRADFGAAEMVGKKPIIKALEKVRNWKEIKIDPTHENINIRIEKLKRLPLPDFIRITS